MPPITRRGANALFAALPPPVVAALRVAVRLAAGARLAVVGGSVRDLALGLPLDYDLDLVVEGDAPALARLLAQQLGGALQAEHAAFGTATLHAPLAGRLASIDVSTARRETYAHPAALPSVAPAALDDDLARRDFSLNALALEVLPAPELGLKARLLDPLGGLADLEAGRLRVLHDASFRDDPTRILRGLRLAARLGLAWEPRTLALLGSALADAMLERTSPERVCAELCLALAEPEPERVLERADQAAVTPHIFPALRWTPAQRVWWQRAQLARPVVAKASLALGLLTYDLADAERAALRERYRLPGDAARLLHEIASLKALRNTLRDPALPNSQLDALLAPFSAEAIVVAQIAEHEALSSALARYIQALRTLAPLLNGRDLLALGMRPGPPMGALLAQVRAAQADMIITTHEEALAFARQRLPE